MASLDLHDNDLASLPDDLLDGLTALVGLDLSGNDGAPFRPVAGAGADQTVGLGTTVTLSGAVTGAWGDNVKTWAWTQVDGEDSDTAVSGGVTLTDADAATASFTAPDTAATLYFRLTVTPVPGASNAHGRAAGKDWVTVTVETVDNTAPRVSAIDTTAPRVSAIERQTPATSPTSADSLTWRVTFSEDVDNVDATDFAVDGTTATLAVGTVTASTVYDVQASGGNLADLDATVTLSFATDQDIADTSDNALANTAPTGTDDATYVVDNTAPAVNSATVDGAVLVIAFDEALAAAPGLANDAFEVSKTPSGGSGETVALSGAAPVISGATVTLTLAAAVSSTDTGVKVSYTQPATDDDNRLEDAAGNEVATFDAPLAVSNDTDLNPTDASLSTLALADAGGGAFERTLARPALDVYRVRVSVSNDVAVLTVSPTTTHPGARVERYSNSLNQNIDDADPLEDGHQVALAVGTNPIHVWVRAANGSTGRMYRLSVTREAFGLSALSLGDAVELAPQFKRTTRRYAALVAHDVDALTIVATANHSGASVGYLDGDNAAIDDADLVADGRQVNLAVGENTLKVRVEHGGLTRTYTLTVTRLGSGDGLTAVLVRSGSFELPGGGFAWPRFELLLSEAVWISEGAMGKHVFEVTDGHIERVHRVTSETATVDGKQRTVSARWRLTVRPDYAVRPVMVSMTPGRPCAQAGALCTADGGRLANAPSLELSPWLEAAPPAPVVLRVRDQKRPESRGYLDFQFLVRDASDTNLSKSIPEGIELRMRTVAGDDDDDAEEGKDYRAVDETLIIPPGHSSWDVDVVPLIPDDEDEADETVDLEVSDAWLLRHGVRWARLSIERQAASGSDDILETDTTVTVEGTIEAPDDAMKRSGGAMRRSGVAALTVRFENAPASHDGSTRFTVELVFSAAPHEKGNQDILAALVVEGATKVRMRRIDKDNAHRRVTIEPDGDGAVTLSFPETTQCTHSNALCTAEGGRLEEEVAITIPGPVAISVADARVEEAEGAELAFVVSLDRAHHAAVTVDYATGDGTAKADEDYTGTEGTLVFAGGETEKTVSVAVIDDAHDEGEETVVLKLSHAVGARIEDGEATGIIENSDAMPGAWLSRFGRTVAEQVLDAVEGRMRAPRTPGAQASVAGRRVGGGAAGFEEARERARLDDHAAWWHGGESEAERSGVETRPVRPRELLLGSSFSLSADGAGGSASVWGEAAVSRFDAREGALSLDGEVASGLFGVEWAREGSMAGLIVSHSRGEGGYGASSRSERHFEASSRSERNRNPGAGTVSSTLTGLWPWGRHVLTERVSVWGVAGYGEGTLTLTPEGPDGESGAAMRTDTDLVMGSVGVRGVVVEAPSHGGFELSVTGDALGVWTSSDAVRGGAGNLAASEAEVTRLRLGLEGSWRGLHIGTGTVEPRLELGARHDGGDAETGAGLDVGGAVAWSDPARGLRAELGGRGLLTHESGGFGERGVAASLVFDPAPGSERGPSLRLTQTVGARATGGMDALLGPETARALGAAEEDALARRRFEAKLGYGFAVLGGGWTGTPEVGLGWSESVRETEVGWRLLESRGAGLAFGLDVEGARVERAAEGEAPEHRLGLGFGWRLRGAGRERFEVRFEGARRTPGDAAPAHEVGLRLTARW